MKIGEIASEGRRRLMDDEKLGKVILKVVKWKVKIKERKK
jgi:hypothetical protein